MIEITPQQQIDILTIIVQAFDAGRNAAQYYGTDEMQKYRSAKVSACEVGEEEILKLIENINGDILAK